MLESIISVFTLYASLKQILLNALTKKIPLSQLRSVLESRPFFGMVAMVACLMKAGIIPFSLTLLRKVSRDDFKSDQITDSLNISLDSPSGAYFCCLYCNFLFKILLVNCLFKGCWNGSNY